MTRYREVAAFVAAVVLLGLLGCDDDAPAPLYVIMSDREMERGKAEFSQPSNGCMSVSRDASGGSFSFSASGRAGTGAPPLVAPQVSDDFTVQREEQPEGLRVTLLSGPQLLGSKLYSFGFLNTHQIDVIEASTAAGTRHQLAHRGASTCESSDLFAQRRELHVRYQHHDILPDAVIESESGCIDIDVGDDERVKVEDDGDAGSGGSADLDVTRTITNVGLRVRGVSEIAGNKVLMDKLFSPDFIRSEVTDITEIQGSDRRYQIAHRGVLSCDIEVDLFAK